MSALATVAQKNFDGKFTAKIDFPIGHFQNFTVADADIGNLKSLYTLFDKYLEYILVKFERNRMVQTIQNFVFFWQKMFNKFWQSVDASLEDVSVTETIGWC